MGIYFIVALLKHRRYFYLHEALTIIKNTGQFERICKSLSIMSYHFMTYMAKLPVESISALMPRTASSRMRFSPSWMVDCKASRVLSR